MIRAPRYRVVALVAALAVTAAGCTFRHAGQNGPDAAVTSRSAAATAGSSAVTVTGTPDGHPVTVTDTGQRPALTPDLSFLADVYSLTPSEPLSSAVAVVIALPSPAPAGDAVLIATRETGDQAWSYLPAAVTADRKSVSFTTRHLSLFGPIGYNLSRQITAFESDFRAALAAGAPQTITTPVCEAAPAARTGGYSVTSSTTDTVKWCLGEDSTGHRIMKVANNRRYPLEVAHPNMDVVTNGYDRLQAAALNRFSGRPAGIIEPGGTATFNADLSPGRSEAIHTQLDGLGQSLYVLHTGVEALGTILTRFGAGAGITAGVVTDILLTARSCTDSVIRASSDAVIAGCFSEKNLRAAYGARAFLITPVTTAAEVAGFFRTEWDTVIDQFNRHDRYSVTIRRSAPTLTFAALAGTWYGHTRWVTLSPAGAVSESVGIGCCRPQFDATYQLSDLRGTPNDATATATVTSFTVHPDFVHPGGPTAPKVGQTGTVTFKQGVLTLPFIGGGIPYCNAQDTSGVCGA